MIFVTSWDDGHPLDERLADLLYRYGLPGTFFIPIHNLEGRPVISIQALRRLDSYFEIGSHTLDHVLLTEVSPEECLRQVTLGKTELEQHLGHPIKGFCYPHGKWNYQVRLKVKCAGFDYARTIENFRLDWGNDLYTIPTSIQIFPHGKHVLLSNYIRFGHYRSRFKIFAISLISNNWLDYILRVLDMLLDDNSILHVWGHSWEIEEKGLWPQLENFFSLVASRSPTLCTINELTQILH